MGLNPGLCSEYEMYGHSFLGEHPEGPQDLLSSLQQAREVQGDAVQEVAGVYLRAGQASLRQKAAGLRWPVQAHLAQEGKNCLYTSLHYLALKLEHLGLPNGLTC